MSERSRVAFRGLYAITDGPRGDLLEMCAAALTGGARLLQYRDKTSDHRRRVQEATALRRLCADHAATFIVNDDVALAAEVAADGVHLGAEDAAIGGARGRLGEGALIGVSCYDALERARTLAALGADALAFGAVFASPTKPFAPASTDAEAPVDRRQFARQAPLSLFGAARMLGLPLIAIGGITPDNAAEVIAAGADAVAVISGLFGTRTTAEVEATARRFAALFAASR